MPGRSFLASYHPLVETRAGRMAIRDHGLPPFIDGSCRREPDFESSYPSISATCRAGKFAPRLQEGDRVAYLTVKRKYPDALEPVRYLVAVLRVIKRFGSHIEAAAWYLQRGQPIPSNCFVDGNSPKEFHLTNGKIPDEDRERLKGDVDPPKVIRVWDRSYRSRITTWPVFLATEADLLDLNRPPCLSDDQLRAIFGGKIPCTENPARIAARQMDRLVDLGKQASAG